MAKKYQSLQWRCKAMIVTPAQNSIIKIKAFNKFIYLHSTLQKSIQFQIYTTFSLKQRVYAILYFLEASGSPPDKIYSAYKNGAFAQNSLLSPLYNII